MVVHFVFLLFLCISICVIKLMWISIFLPIIKKKYSLYFILFCANGELWKEERKDYDAMKRETEINHSEMKGIIFT